MDSEKFDIYTAITDRMIAQLENGDIPWIKPWFGIADGAFNRVTKRTYSLLNQMLLSHSGEYATFKQWEKLGGKIKKGAKSEFVVFWKFIKKKLDEEDNTAEEIKIPLLKYYRVFHISQVEGVEPLKIPSFDIQPIAKAEDLILTYIKAEGIKFIQIGNNASYSPLTDTVKVPPKNQFMNINEYYSTVFHELTHSTGHKNRLDRFNHVTLFGDETYSKEELIAKIGNAALMNILGIETKSTFANSARYVLGWLNALKNDKRLLVSAAGKAEKAVDLIIHGRKENLNQIKTDEDKVIKL